MTKSHFRVWISKSFLARLWKAGKAGFWSGFNDPRADNEQIEKNWQEYAAKQKEPTNG